VNYELNILLISAVSIAFFHTIFGPDHYLPFIVMARSGEWSITKTVWITVLCGIGHVLSSVILGLLGIGFGVALSELISIESFRGDIAAWLLIAFGFMYFVWGMKKAYMNKPHRHVHFNTNGKPEIHSHTHAGKHAHERKNEKKSMTPWILFTIFVFGPCEPLIPLLMYPAATHSNTGLITVALVFGITTILTMLSVVLVSLWGINLIPLGKFEKFSHALAGASICLSGLAIIFLGL
jgi:nickel/cobalt transporter (NicO) family protein